MPIRHCEGDLLASHQQTLVCPVNLVGVMGAGLALQMANRYPNLLKEYQHACRTGLLRVDCPFPIRVSEHQQVLCLATKDHFRYPSDLSWVAAGLSYTQSHMVPLGIQSLAIPMLGCGLGQLEWGSVRRLLYYYLQHELTDIEVYGP